MEKLVGIDDGADSAPLAVARNEVEYDDGEGKSPSNSSADESPLALR
ncbi:hypothetical protein OG470_16565 [Micromonospora sp. NBC_00389]